MVFLWFSYGFPMVFLQFPLWAGGRFPFAGRHRPRLPAPLFLWFSYGFPMVFLWFSYNFRSGPVAVSHLPAATVRGCPPLFSYGFPMVFLWFSYGFPTIS